MESEENNCAICHTEIEENDEVEQLKCGHKYHYECIFITYKFNKCKYKGSKLRKCPYCREDGGYLSLKNNIVPVKDIHEEYIKFVQYLVEDNRDEYMKFLNKDKCFAILKTGKNKNDQCSFKPVENNFCKKHKKAY